MVSSVRVLAVDDEQMNLELIKDYLADHTDGGIIHLTTASSAVEALKILNSGKPIELILLDNMMPDMTGLELLALLKKHNDFSKIPVIIQTASSDRKTVQQAAALQADAYILKPYSASDLISKMSECISWLK